MLLTGSLGKGWGFIIKACNMCGVKEKTDPKQSSIPRFLPRIRTKKENKKVASSPNMMPTAGGVSHMIPNHVLRVGQTVRLDAAQKPLNQRADMTEAGDHGDPELDISLDNLNQLIMELDPTFEPIGGNKSPSCVSPATDDSEDDDSDCVLVPRGCPPCSSPTVQPSLSPSIPIPSPGGLSCSPHGTLVFSGSPSSSLPPLPCGSAPRRASPARHDASSQGSLHLSNRISAASLLSTSTCSDTSYMLGSTLSLASDDADSPDSLPTPTSGPLPTKHGHLQELHGKAQSSPASLSSSLTDIPVLLINGAPQSDLPTHPSPLPQAILTQTPPSPRGFQAHFNGSQPSMRFIMDSSKFWFRPHISRAEAEMLVKDKQAGTFVVRDSTSYRGSFGLAMKVDPTSANLSTSAYPGESNSDLIRHFLIESSAKGVRIKGSSQEPYFGSLSALVYQHSISAYALPCKLLIHSQGEERANDKAASPDKIGATSNFVYLNTVPTETLTGPCAVQRAVSSTLEKAPGSFIPAIVNLKVSPKGVTLTDINRKLFFRRHYPAHLLSYGGEDPDERLWMKGSSFGARMFGFVAKGVEAGMENVCHVFAEYDPLQPCGNVVRVIQAVVARPQAQ